MTAAATVDLSDVQALTDDELATVLALFTAEIARREATSDVCPAHCKSALSHVSLCECRSCRGENHGADHRASREHAIASMRARADYNGGFTHAMVAAANDDEMFVSADVRRARLATLDPEDYF